MISLATYRCALPGCYRSGYIEIASVLLHLCRRVAEDSRKRRRVNCAAVLLPVIVLQLRV